MAVTGDGVKAGIKAEAGVKWDKAHTDSTSKGDESRDTGSFSVGLRVPGTPFQSMPAGSLLLVQTVPGSTSLQDVIDVRVLHAPVSSVLIAQNADLYLVVNDLGGCADTSADALSVTITPMQALASQAKQLTGAMAGVYNSLRQRAALASERGVLTPTEISAMHDEAVAQVTTACNCDFSSYPAPLRELFGTWVNKELVALERQVAMFKDRKSMELAVIERDGLSAELATQAEKRRLQYLLPAWMLRNLDADALRESMRPLLRSLTQELFPFLQLRYPSALVHGSEASSRLSTLLQNTWATATVDLADQVTHTASVLMTEAVTSIRDNPPTKSSDLAVLSFPNPTGTVPAGSIWFQASPESAGASWSAINNDNARTASFQIRPEDLYSAQGGPSILSCTDSAPVITASALFVSLDSEATGQRLSSQNWGVPLKIGGAQSFATAAGVPSFRFPSAWLSQEIPVLFGISGDAVNVFKQFAATTNVAQGLSPFTRFDVDLSALKPLEDQGILSFASDGSGVPEMLMMFQLETRPQGTSVGGVTTCH
jgi:hypothetical protein